MEVALVSFFIVLFAGVFFSTLFARLHLPWVVALIVAGIIIGPHGIGVFSPDSTIEFLAEIGLIFLMFMAGLETRLGSFKNLKKEVSVITALNGLLPFILGFGIASAFGYPFVTALIVGIIFISSSIAVVIPSLEAQGLIHTHIGRSIVASTIFQDIASLVAVSILLQNINPSTPLPLPLFYILVFVAVVALRWLIVNTRNYIHTHHTKDDETFQQEPRVILLILIGTVIVFELLGLHPIIGGFFAGLVLSGVIKSTELKEKLRAISYGIFIPIFFVIIGSKADIGIFAETQKALPIALAIVIGSISIKFLSGLLAGAVLRNKREGLLIGAATIPQLSTTLAVAATGFALGLLDQNLITALVILSIITTLASPLLIRWLKKYYTTQI